MHLKLHKLMGFTLVGHEPAIICTSIWIDQLNQLLKLNEEEMK